MSGRIFLKQQNDYSYTGNSGGGLASAPHPKQNNTKISRPPDEVTALQKRRLTTGTTLLR